MKYFIHPTALVETKKIGKNTRVWAFSHIMNGASVGSNCNIGDHSFIESGVKIGNNVVIKNGVSVWRGVTIEDNVFVGPNAVFTNDLVPRSKVFRKIVPTRIKKGASIGANATLLCGIKIGSYAMIGAGAVVTKDVPDFALVYGNPAVLRGYICKCGLKLKRRSKKEISCSCGFKYRFKK